MVLALVSINNPYCDDISKKIKRFVDNGWEIFILTNHPNDFTEYNTVFYPYKIFSYYYKLLFSLSIVEKYDKDVLYVDIKNIDEVSDNIIKNFKGSDKFIFLDHWQVLVTRGSEIMECKFDKWEKFNDNIDPYFIQLKEYFNKINFDYSEMITIWERIMYFPKYKNVSEIILELEKIKPIFEYSSIINDSDYKNKGIGNAEGLAMSYILNKFNLPYNKFYELGY